MATPIEIFQTKVTTAADALALINGVFQWAFGPTPPSITFPFLNWANTDTNSWYQRNADDNAWVFKGALDAAFAPMNGWISGLTAVYVSPNQMKIETLNITDRIQQGTKIRYKQGDTWKYDFVSETAFSTDSLLTLMGGSTVEDAPITDFAFGNIANPIGWPFGVDYIKGSNENGTWRKWADGTLECWGVKDLGSVSITQSEGGFYRSDGSTYCNFPVAFYSLPTFCEVQIYQVDSNHYIWLLPQSYNSLSTTQTWYFFLGRGDSATINNVKVSYHAIGRWKE